MMQTRSVPKKKKKKEKKKPNLQKINTMRKCLNADCHEINIFSMHQKGQTLGMSRVLSSCNSWTKGEHDIRA